MAYRLEWHYGTYEQWFLAFEPRHPYLYKMINKMTYDILHRIQLYQYNGKKELILRYNKYIILIIYYVISL